MPDQKDIDQDPYDMLGLGAMRKLQLKPLQLMAARKRAEEEVDQMYAQKEIREQKKEKIYDAYMQIIREKRTKKQWEFNELLEEAADVYLEDDFSPPKEKPKTQIVVTNSAQIDGFLLLKGTVEDIQKLFDKWIVHNGLQAAGFSSEIAKNFLIHTLTIRGPQEGPHSGKLGLFFEQLIKDGYINGKANTNAMSLPTALPTLIPMPQNRKKRVDEEEEKNDRSSLGIPKPFGKPKLERK